MLNKVCGGGKGAPCGPPGQDSGDGRFTGSHCKQRWPRIEALLPLQPPEYGDYGSEPPHPCEGPRAHSFKIASSRNQFKLSLSFSLPVKAAFSATQALKRLHAGIQSVLLSRPRTMAGELTGRGDEPTAIILLNGRKIKLPSQYFSRPADQCSFVSSSTGKASLYSRWDLTEGFTSPRQGPSL